MAEKNQFDIILNFLAEAKGLDSIRAVKTVLTALELEIKKLADGFKIVAQSSETSVKKTEGAFQSLHKKMMDAVEGNKRLTEAVATFGSKARGNIEILKAFEVQLGKARGKSIELVEALVKARDQAQNNVSRFNMLAEALQKSEGKTVSYRNALLKIKDAASQLNVSWRTYISTLAQVDKAMQASLASAKLTAKEKENLVKLNSYAELAEKALKGQIAITSKGFVDYSGVIKGVNLQIGNFSKVSDQAIQKLREQGNSTPVPKLRIYQQLLKDIGATNTEFVRSLGVLYRQTGENSLAFGRLGLALRKVETAIQNKISQLGAGSSAAKAYAESIDRVKMAHDLLAGKIKITNNEFVSATRAKENVKKSAAQLRDEMTLLERVVDRVGRSFKTLTSYFMAGASIYGFITAIGSAKNEIVEFDQALHNIRAITGATATEMEKMKDVILEVASTTKFSTKEVADGMVILGQAGFSAVESMQMIKPVSDLATATLTDFKDTSDLVTTTIRAFHLQASDTTKVVDTFAAAINGSKLTMDKLRVSFNYLAPVAEAANMSVGETTAALGLLANSGIRASTMGTGLRQVLSRLIEPSEAFAERVKELGGDIEKMNPLTNDFRTIIGELSSTVTDAGVAFELFGLRGAPIVSALAREGTVGFDEMKLKISEAGKAAEMAGIQLEGLGLTIKQIFDKIKTLTVSLSEDSGLTGAFRSLLQIVKAILQFFIDITNTALGEFTVKVVGLTVALGTLVLGLGLLKAVFIGLTTTILPKFAVSMGLAKAELITLAAGTKTLSSGLFILKAAFTSLMVVNPFILALAALAAVFTTLSSVTKAYKDSLSKLSDEQTKYIALLEEHEEKERQNITLLHAAKSVLDSTSSSYEGKINALRTLSDHTILLTREMIDEISTLEELNEFYAKHKTTLEGLIIIKEKERAAFKIQEIAETAKTYKLLQKEIEHVKKELSEFGGWLDSIAESLRQTIDPFGWFSESRADTLKAKLTELEEKAGRTSQKLSDYAQKLLSYTDEQLATYLMSMEFSDKEVSHIIENENKISLALFHELAKRSGFVKGANDEDLQVVKDVYNQMMMSFDNQTQEFKNRYQERLNAFKESKEEELELIKNFHQEEEMSYSDALIKAKGYFSAMRQVAEETYSQEILLIKQKASAAGTSDSQLRASLLNAAQQHNKNIDNILKDELALYTDLHKDIKTSHLGILKDLETASKGYLDALQGNINTARDIVLEYDREMTELRRKRMTEQQIEADKQRVFNDALNETKTKTNEYATELGKLRDLQKSDAPQKDIDAQQRKVDALKKEVDAQIAIMNANKDTARAEQNIADIRDAKLKVLEKDNEYNEDLLRITEEKKRLEEASYQSQLKVKELLEEHVKAKQKSKEATEDEAVAIDEVNTKLEGTKEKLDEINEMEIAPKVDTKMQVDGKITDVTPGVSHINSVLDKIKKELTSTITVVIKYVTEGTPPAEVDGYKEGGYVLPDGGKGAYYHEPTHSGAVRMNKGGFLGKFLKFASGGRLPGFGGGDRIPILAEAGEYVVNKFATARNKSLLDAINSQQSNLTDFVATAQQANSERSFSGGGSVPAQGYVTHRHTFVKGDGVEDSFEVIGDENNDSFEEFVRMIDRGNLTRRL